MAASIRKARAERKRGVIGFAVAPRCLAVIDLTAEAFKIRIENDVHNTGHSVGAIGRRGAARDGFNTLNHRGWNDVEIHGAAIGARHETARVHKRQRARAVERVKAAKVGEAGADIGAGRNPRR